MEKDKLIAEFMGFTYETNIGWYDNEMMMPQIVYDNENGNCFEELLFSRSWDWLMPVVGKISKVAAGGVTYDVRNALQYANIEDVYKVVIEFIDRYNKNK